MHPSPAPGAAPVLLDCGETWLGALRHCKLDPGEIAAVFVSRLHGDHFGGLPFARRTRRLMVIGPRGGARRPREAMDCLFPGSAAAARFPVDLQI